MTDFIALRSDLRIGDTAYMPGDKFDPEAAVENKQLSEGQLRILKVQGFYAELTPDTFAICLVRRPAGSKFPPRGFTRAYLEAKGLIEPEGKAAAPPPEPAKRPVPAKIVVDRITLGNDAIVVGDYRIQCKMNGRFRLYDVTDPDGRLLRAQAFRNEDGARKFIAELAPGSTAPAGADTSEGETSEETGDGGELRSGTDG